MTEADRNLALYSAALGTWRAPDPMSVIGMAGGLQAWHAFQFRNAPPEAIAALKQWEQRRATTNKTATAPTRPPEEATGRPSGTRWNQVNNLPHGTRMTTATELSVNWIAPELKAFTTPTAAYRAGKALMAGMGRAIGGRNGAAELYCQRHGITEVPHQVQNAATTGTPTAGGYLVPDELTQAILTSKARAGSSRRLCFVSPMSSSSQSIPWETEGLTVRYIDEAPATAPTASDVAWGQVGLTTRKRGVLGYISQELDGDALIRYVDRYADRAGHALAKQEDRELVLGDGTSTYGGEVGLLASLGAGGKFTAATGHDTWPELDVDDFTGCMAKLPEAFADGRESWICSAAFYAVGMLGAVGGSAQGFADDGRPLYLGKPVNILPAMPATTAAATVCCLYGSWAEVAVIGDRGVMYTFSDQAAGAFDRNLIAMKAFSRYDIAIHNAGDASNAGGYVGLSTAA